MPISSENMKRYPGGSIHSKEWHEIRERIRRRAGNRCEQCGVPNHALGGRLRDGTFLRAQPKGEKLARLEWPQPGEEWWCGSDEPVRLRIIRIVCTTAHVDHGLDDHSDENLRFWCQRCHNRHDAKSRAANAAKTRRRKAGQTDLEDFL